MVIVCPSCVFLSIPWGQLRCLPYSERHGRCHICGRLCFGREAPQDEASNVKELIYHQEGSIYALW